MSDNGDLLTRSPSPEVVEESESGGSNFDEYIEDGEGTSSSSSFDEIGEDDFPSYFSERNGRLYHSNPNAPYPLPVDTPEQQRFNVSHNILKRLMGRNYVGPVQTILAPGQERKVLDLCHGNGKWLLEMSEEFPHVQFLGIDNVPITTRYPPEKVRFVLADVNMRLDWDDATFDLVHARDTSMAVTDYHYLVAEAARVLKPGGLFLTVERDRSPHFHPSFGLDPEEHAPAATRLYQLVGEALLASHNIHISPFQCSDALSASAQFEGLERRQFYMPIGGWHETPDLRRMGLAFKVAEIRLARAFRQLLLDNTELVTGEIDTVIQDYADEIRNGDGFMSTIHVAYATKVQA